jgi:hypothetical protein
VNTRLLKAVAGADRLSARLLDPDEEPMTEAQWLRSNGPGRMVTQLCGIAYYPRRPGASPADVAGRWARLFGCASLRATWAALGPGSESKYPEALACVEAAEGYLDGDVTEERMNDVGDVCSRRDDVKPYSPIWWPAASVTLVGIPALLLSPAENAVTYRHRSLSASSQADILRDVVGCYWRPWFREGETPGPTTSAYDVLPAEVLSRGDGRVRNIAGEMYKTRDFSAASILADALTEAGVTGVRRARFGDGGGDERGPLAGERVFPPDAVSGVRRARFGDVPRESDLSGVRRVRRRPPPDPGAPAFRQTPLPGLLGDRPVDREVTPGGATRMKPKRLTTDEMNECAMTVCRLADTIQLYEQTQELRERVKVFEAAVWFPRLQAVVNGTDARGMSGACRDVKVMTWCCAGRCLIQLTRGDEKPWSRDNAHVACHMGPMGVQHVDAEYVDALKLIHTATRYGAEMTLTRDDAVTIG